MSIEPLHATLPNRKAIHAAGVLLIQPDGDIAASWRDALLDFGMSGVRTVIEADAAIDLIQSSKPSGIVIALPNLPDAYALMSRLMASEAGDLRDIPVVLVTGQPTRTTVITASNAGFDAVLPFPLPPRLIYRRMGSLMQRARRVVRQRMTPQLSVVAHEGERLDN